MPFAGSFVLERAPIHQVRRSHWLPASAVPLRISLDMKDFVRNLKKGGILGYKDEEEKEDDPRDRFRGKRR